MKKCVVMLALCALSGCVGLSGCSKAKNASATSGNSVDSSTADGSVEMKIKWTVGKEYPMHMDMDQTTKTDVPGQPQPIVQEVKLTQDFDFSTLKQLDNGGWQLELRFDSETMSVFQGDRSVMSFNSAQSPAQDAGDPAAPILRAMIGARIQYFTDANGKVEKVGGVDELRNRISATAQPQQQAMYSQMFSEETFKQYGSFADAMPNRTVAIGDSWQVKKDVTSPIGVLTLDMKYTFKNWEQHAGRPCVHVQAEGNISTKSISNATGVVVEIKKGDISGEFWYDPKLGTIVEVNNDQDMSLKITTRAQTMTSQFNQQVRVALVEGQ